MNWQWTCAFGQIRTEVAHKFLQVGLLYKVNASALAVFWQCFIYVCFIMYELPTHWICQLLNLLSFHRCFCCASLPLSGGGQTWFWGLTTWRETRTTEQSQCWKRVREAPVADFSQPPPPRDPDYTPHPHNTKVNHHTLVPRGRGAQSGQRVYDQLHGETLRRECDLRGGRGNSCQVFDFGNRKSSSRYFHPDCDSYTAPLTHFPLKHMTPL